MGLLSSFKSWQERRRERIAAEGRERQREEARDRHVEWRSDIKDAEDLVAGLRDWRGLVDESDQRALIPKKGEEILITANGAGLVESRRQPGQYQGGSHGISFPIVKSVRYRVGAHRGTFHQGDEVLSIVDVGTFVVTNQRAVFVGSQKNREWAWSKVLSVNGGQMDEGDYALYIAVSNRQKVSGVAGDPESIASLHQRVELGIAIFNGREDDFFAALEGQLLELRQAEPVSPFLADA